MGDYTQVQVYVTAAPEGATAEAFEAVAQALNDYGLGHGWGDAPGGAWTAEDVRTVLVGSDEPATDYEGRLGVLDEVGEVMAAHGFSFYGWEDPAYEWPGSYVAHVPGLGMFSGSCNADGSVTLNASELLQMVNTAEDLDGLREGIRTRTGAAWRDALGLNG